MPGLPSQLSHQCLPTHQFPAHGYPRADSHTCTSRSTVRIRVQSRDAPDKTDLYILNVESGEITPLITGFDAVAFPKWSPDDQKIFFYSDRGGNMDLWMFDADGANPVQLMDDEYYDAYPHYWAP